MSQLRSGQPRGLSVCGIGAAILALLGALQSGCGSSNDSPASSSGAPEGGGASLATGGSANAINSGAGLPGTTSGGASAGGTTGSSGASGASASGGSASGGSASGGSAATGCNAPTLGAKGVCQTYAPTSIAAIRNPAMPGCYELSHVGLVARTDSPTEPRLYVQDASGGDFSALLAKCSANAQHNCSAAVLAKIPLLFDTMNAGARLSVRGYYQNGKSGGFEEFFIEDVIDECTTVPRAEPITLAVADITKDARKPGKWFRRANVTIPAQDPLVMYDFSPPDLNLAAPSCPDWAGFAMISKSAGVAAPSGCMGSNNPAARPMNPAEILIGRQFFNQFLYSADCACAAKTNQRLLAPANSVSGVVRGYLILEADAKSTATTYQVFEAAADQTFPMK